MKYLLITGLLLLFSCSNDVDNLSQNTTNTPDYLCQDTCGPYQSKTLICHLPPGNTNNLQTICVSNSAAATHLQNHYDYCGQCDDQHPECGDGVCEAPESCSSCDYDCGLCPPVCGDGTCDITETCDSCSSDCGVCPPVCNDGVCSLSETCESCACDCGTCEPVCGDNICQEEETCETCAADCGECPTCNPTCGDDVCDEGETCSTCESDCGECSPVCGDALCEGVETCDTCVTDCGDCVPVCGDGTCNTLETCSSCTEDCGQCPPTCGDGVCADDENCAVCPSDCGECPDYQPDAGLVMPDSGNGDAGNAPEPAITVVGGELLGCNSGSSKGTFLTVMFLVVVFLTARSKKLIPFLVLLTTVSLSSVSIAQVVGDPGEFKLERFELGYGYNSMLTIEGAEVGLVGSKGMNVFLGYSNDPLVVQSNTGTGWNRVGSLIGDQVSGSIGGYYGLIDNLSLGLDVPLVVYQGRDAGNLTGLSNIKSSGLGDPKFMVKYQALSKDNYHLSLGGSLTFPLPTKNKDYITEKGLTFVPYVAASKTYVGWRVIGNLGIKLRQSSEVIDLKVGNEVLIKLGVGKKVGDSGELMLTLSGNTSLSDTFTNNSDYSEAMLGYSRDYGNGWSSFIGSGVGLNQGFGAPDWRGFLGMKFDFKKSKTVIPVTAIETPPTEEEPEIEVKPEPVPEKPTTKLVLTVPGAFFKFNQSYVPNVYRKKLQEFASTLMIATSKHPELKLFTIVAGHTDSLGTQEYNALLAERRAKAVANVLYKSGVPKEMVIITVYGEMKPIESNKTVEGRAANRRVEVFIGGDKKSLEYYDIITNKDKKPTGRSTYDRFGNLPNR